MFSGIVQGLFRVVSVNPSSLTISFSPQFCRGLVVGASVAVDGVCLTVVSLNQNEATFDIIAETIKRTTLGQLREGQTVGCERSLRYGDEVGGHLVSGHVFGMAAIREIKGNEYTLSCPKEWVQYLFPKGYVALDGASLTIVDVSEEGFFSVQLILETLRMTSLGSKKAGDPVNLEIDSQTQAIVQTLSRYGIERFVHV